MTLKIRHKILVLVALPLIAIFAFAALAIITTGGEAVRADQLRRMVVINKAIGDVVSDLQTERSAAVHALTRKKNTKELSEFRRVAEDTDASINRFDVARSKAGELPDGLTTVLEDADEELGQLESMRGEVTDGSQTAAAVAFAYRIPVTALVEYREAVPQAGGASSHVGDMIRNPELISATYTAYARGRPNERSTNDIATGTLRHTP